MNKLPDVLTIFKGKKTKTENIDYIKLLHNKFGNVPKEP